MEVVTVSSFKELNKAVKDWLYYYSQFHRNTCNFLHARVSLKVTRFEISCGGDIEIRYPYQTYYSVIGTWEYNSGGLFSDPVMELSFDDVKKEIRQIRLTY